MKKELILLLFLIFIPGILSIDLTLKKNSYHPRETLQAEIIGNFVSLSKENINIYYENKIHSEPVISDIYFYDNKYYYYAILPNQEGNFSLKIENTQYLESGEIKNDPITKQFIIIKSNTSALNINPGFIYTDKDFSIKLTSITGYQKISAKLVNQSHELSLVEDDQKEINFKIAGLNNFEILKINNYEIPVFTLKSKNSTPVILEKIKINTNPGEINAKINSKKDYFFVFYIENLNNITLYNLTISNNFNGKLFPESIPILISGNRQYVNMSFKTDSTKNITGKIFVNSSNISTYIPVIFEIVKNPDDVNISITPNTQMTCRKLGGYICNSTTTCNGQISKSLDGPCCIGQCISEKKKDSGLWVGIIIIIFVILVLALLYFTSKKKPKSSEEILKERTEKYMKKIKPSKEVDDKLTKN